MVLDAYKKEAEKAAAPATPDKPERTLKHILADKSDSAMFAEMLGSTGDVDDQSLTERLLQNKLTPDDIVTLDEKRSEFLGKLETSKDIVKNLDPKIVAQMAGLSDEFKAIVNLAGPEATSKILQKKVQELMFSKPAEFQNIADKVSLHTRYMQGDFKELDEQTGALLKKVGVSEGAFAKIMQNTDEKERTKALRQEIRSQYSGFRKAIDSVLVDFLPGKNSREWAKELSGKKTDIDLAFTRIETQKALIADTLNDVIINSANPEFLSALANEALSEGKKNDKEKLLSFKDARTLPSGEALERDIDARWAQFKTDNAAHFGADADAMANAFQYDEEARYKKQVEAGGGGFLSTIIQGLFANHLKNKTLA